MFFARVFCCCCLWIYSNEDEIETERQIERERDMDLWSDKRYTHMQKNGSFIHMHEKLKKSSPSHKALITPSPRITMCFVSVLFVFNFGCSFVLFFFLNLFCIGATNWMREYVRLIIWFYLVLFPPNSRFVFVVYYYYYYFFVISIPVDCKYMVRNMFRFGC